MPRLQNLQLAALRVGVDLKLFNHLAGQEDPLTVAQLSERTGADQTLLGKYDSQIKCLFKPT